ncbi:MAG: tetratricopeptide repeat protein, partial [Bacteroidales bacterium]|nr:tetratricopeptide repeat protein [Bacteroidales bacterium]
MNFIRIKLLLVIGLWGLLTAASIVPEVGESHALSIAEDIIIEAIEINPDEAGLLIDSLIVLDAYDPDLIKGMMAYYKGELNYALGQWKEAGEHYLKSIDHFILIEDSAKLAAAFNNMGLVHSFQGNYDQSLMAYSQSLEFELGMQNAVG